MFLDRCAGFGTDGEIDLNPAAGPQRWRGEYQVTSPPAVIGDLMVVGSAISDSQRCPGEGSRQSTSRPAKFSGPSVPAATPRRSRSRPAARRGGQRRAGYPGSGCSTIRKKPSRKR
jgi:hypothetical protein